LVALVVVVGEHVRQQLLLAELRDRPPERQHAGRAAGDVGPAGGVPAQRRGGEPHRAERAARQPQPLVPGPPGGGPPRPPPDRAAASSRAFGWSRNSRSSPFTENTSAFALIPAGPRTPDRKIEYSRNSAKLVFVATPDTPEIDTCAPRVPSRNSMFRYTGLPS